MDYFCEYCGDKLNIKSITSKSCAKHPNGFHKGKHKVSTYFCKYCGIPLYLYTTAKLCHGERLIKQHDMQHKQFKGNRKSYAICMSCDIRLYCPLYLLDLHSHCNKHKNIAILHNKILLDYILRRK